MPIINTINTFLILFINLLFFFILDIPSETKLTPIPKSMYGTIDDMIKKGMKLDPYALHLEISTGTLPLTQNIRNFFEEINEEQYVHPIIRNFLRENKRVSTDTLRKHLLDKGNWLLKGKVELERRFGKYVSQSGGLSIVPGKIDGALSNVS